MQGPAPERSNKYTTAAWLEQGSRQLRVLRMRSIGNMSSSCCVGLLTGSLHADLQAFPYQAECKNLRLSAPTLTAVSGAASKAYPVPRCPSLYRAVSFAADRWDLGQH